MIERRTVKRRLREIYRALDLVALLEQMREAQTETALANALISVPELLLQR